MLVAILSIVCFLLTCVVAVCVFRMVQLLKVMLLVEERLEEALDVLETSHKEITVATMTEVFSDEPVVRRAVAAIRSAQEAVLLVANKLLNFNEEKDGE